MKNTSKGKPPASRTKKTEKERKSFWHFLIQKEQRRDVLFTLAAYFIVYFIFTHYYPYPNGISDSGGYVRAASTMKYDGFRPMGYSYFLHFIHGISVTTSFLVFVQYLLNIFASLFLILTIKYLFRPANKWTYYGLVALITLCPTVLYLTNCILSDSLFTSLTIVWIASGIWIMRKFNAFLIILHLLVLWYIMGVRYTALFYPIITAFLFVAGNARLWLRLILVILPLLMSIRFYQLRKKDTRELTGINTFSGFSGWQSANNALNVVPYIENWDTTDIKNNELREFIRFVRNDHTTDSAVKASSGLIASFMWEKSLILKQYLFYKMQQSGTSYLQKWTWLGGNTYNDFGRYVMKMYPGIYVRHFLLPNVADILYPRYDQLMRQFKSDAVEPKLMKEWFALADDEKVEARSNFVQRNYKILPGFHFIIWMLFIAAIVTGLVKRKLFGKTNTSEKVFWLLSVFSMAYFGFSLIAGPFDLRYSAPIFAAQAAVIYIITNLLITVKTSDE
jgi:hypothetical protein